MRTTLRFNNDSTYDVNEQAATAFGGYATPSGWSFRIAVGALVDGDVDGNEMPGAHDLKPGFVGAFAVARQITLGAEDEWFITPSAAISVLAASTHEAGAATDPSFVAGDIRLGAVAGRTFATIWKPYLLARAFGGPVSWTVAGESVTGTDTHHYQLGAGLTVATEFGLTVVVDVAALGEQAVSLAAGFRL